MQSINSRVGPTLFGLGIAALVLAFGIGSGVSFGLFGTDLKQWIGEGIAAHPAVHAANSAELVWQHLKNAHLHAMALSTTCLLLILVVAMTNMTDTNKCLASLLIGTGALYSMVWLSIALLEPTLGKAAAYAHPIPKTLVYLSIGALSVGCLILALNIFFGIGSEQRGEAATADQGTHGLGSLESGMLNT